MTVQRLVAHARKLFIFFAVVVVVVVVIAVVEAADRRRCYFRPILLLSNKFGLKWRHRWTVAESAVMAAEAAAIWLFVVQRNEKKSSVGDFVIIITTHTKKMRRTEQRES